MYVLRFGTPCQISFTIDRKLREKYNELYPDKKIDRKGALACFFDDQEFIAFLKNELDNGYELQSDSSIEIIEYDEKKGHPILVELSIEEDVNVYDFETGLLWSSEPGSPEYYSLCKGFYHIYDKKYIDSLKTNRVDYYDIISERDARYCSKSIFDIKGFKTLGVSKISNPEVFSKLLSLTQTELGEVDTTEIIKSSVYIEGKAQERRKVAEMLLAKQKEAEIKQICAEIKQYCAEINPTTQYISFGQSADTYNNGTISPIKNDPNVKPTGGVWACTYSPVPFKHSAWEEYCRDENDPFHIDDGYLDKGFKFTLSEATRLFRIDTKEDFEYLQKKFGTKMMSSSTIDFERLSGIVDGIMVTKRGQCLLDYFSTHLNPTLQLFIKPFCVPGITVFNKSVIENVQDFDHILENQIQIEIQENSNDTNSGYSLSATQINDELGEISRQGLVLEGEKDLIALAEEKDLNIDEEQQEQQ